MNQGRILRQYYNVLGDLPEDISGYCNTLELQRLNEIGYFCGMDYCSNDIYNFLFRYSTLQHSKAVARMVYHFTGDKKAALAALFHDIGSPVFRHSIDYMNGDAATQESTEKYTDKIILNSNEIRELLIKDKIEVEEVLDYKKYPIADNDRPKLSADRLDSVFMGSVVWIGSFKAVGERLTIRQIGNMYRALKIVKNEDNIDEMAFTDLQRARQFLVETNENAKELQSNEDKIGLSLLGEITRLMLKNGEFDENFLYTATEPKVIKRIRETSNNEIKELFRLFEGVKRKQIKTTDVVPPKACFAISNKDLNVKMRLIDPLVIMDNEPKRLMSFDQEAIYKTQKMLMGIDNSKYVYIDKPLIFVKK